jgi:DNA primase
MGAVLYEPQCGVLVDRFRQVILMLDGDVTGRNASKVIAEKLRPISRVQVVELPGATQPDQLSPETIGEMLQKSAISRDILP